MSCWDPGVRRQDSVFWSIQRSQINPVWEDGEYQTLVSHEFPRAEATSPPTSSATRRAHYLPVGPR